MFLPKEAFSALKYDTCGYIRLNTCNVTQHQGIPMQSNGEPPGLNGRRTLKSKSRKHIWLIYMYEPAGTKQVETIPKDSNPMAPYGTPWLHMQPIWLSMAPCGAHLAPHGSIWSLYGTA